MLGFNDKMRRSDSTNFWFASSSSNISSILNIAPDKLQRFCQECVKQTSIRNIQVLANVNVRCMMVISVLGLWVKCTQHARRYIYNNKSKQVTMPRAPYF
jgi:hypothetical protein